jgi:DNA-binding CsgD family transcriptional regulator
LAGKAVDLRRLLNLARLDSLTNRESHIFAVRYGLSGGSPRTLNEIAKRFNLSKEGVRLTLLRAHRRITSGSRRQLESGLTDRPCARLALVIQLRVRPQFGNSARRLAVLLMEEFRNFCPSADIVQFVASLAYPSLESAKGEVDTAVRIVRDQHPGCMKHGMALKRIDKLLSYVHWPEAPKKLTARERLAIRRRGEVSPADGQSSYYSLKMAHFLRFRSRLELDFYRLLEHSEEIVEFHAHPITVPYWLKGRRLTCYPDIFIILSDSRGIVVEIVPLFRMPLWWNLPKFDALEGYCEGVGFGLLVTDGYSCLEEVREYKAKQEYVNEVMRHIETGGTVDFDTYREIRDMYHPSNKDFVGLIVQNGLALHMNPFKISHK